MDQSARQQIQDQMLASVREIVAFGIRRPGSPAGLATERFLEQQFKELGLSDVRAEPVPVHHWAPSATDLRFASDNHPIACFAVPYTAWTPQGGYRAPTVYVGDGNPAALEDADLRGKVAVVDIRFGEFSAAILKAGSHFVHDPTQSIPDGPLHAATWLISNFAAYYQAQRRGAVALVGLLRDCPIDGPEQYVPYDGFLKDLPAVWVGRESAAGVSQRAQQGEEILFTSTGKTEEVTSHNIVGIVPGTTDESIILTCHHDAPFASAVEDASGLAVLLWLAGNFAATPGRLRRSLVFIASSGHFHGGVGNRVFVETHRDGLLQKTVAALGIEHIAEEVEEDGHGGYRKTGRPEVRALFVDDTPCLVQLLRDGTERWELDRTIGVKAYLFGPEPPCDSAPFFTAGIPSACHISGPLYLFDPHDTMDKVRADDLPRVARLFGELVETLDGVGAAELDEGLTRRRDDPPAPPPPWFLPPAAYLGS